MSFDLVHFINEHAQSFHEVLDLIPIPLFAKDRQGKYLTCNKAYEETSGKLRQEMIGKTVYDLWPKSQAELFFLKDKELFDTPGQQIYEADISASFGKKCIVQFHKVTFQNNAGETIGLLGAIFDITERKVMEERLKFLGNHDPLTELPNRRQLIQDFEYESKRALRYDRKLALYYMDINKFKKINDDLGHDTGDALLQFISEKVKNLLRENETIYRVGGDEFCILVPEFDHKEQLKILAERVINGISAINHFGGMEINIGCSVGIAIFPENGKTLAEITTSSDKAMFASKKSPNGGFYFGE
ncbi:MAG: diguanylate cyclase [gamma proteobacterium symbiont of Taylorina sp.]|nr:diguanylate cyclase [gamma proteobacterium symbiont of Taylorina sp.]